MAQRTSPLRDKLHATTRDVIVDALVAQLLETGTLDLTYFALSRRAGVSVRTIYRHFPTRDDLLDELSRRVNAVMGIGEYPRTREGTVDLVRQLFATFDKNASLVTAQVQAGGGKLPAKARQKRISRVDQIFTAALPHLPPERRRAAAGLVTVLLSANTWSRLREVGLAADQAGDITAWAIDTLWRALEKKAPGG